ncbi:MAG TPA: response regulator [Anaerolineae bacterium]|nr:response regulator [Anaerolineae bacterium]HQH39015.1 response regulator [Anaerolineae bacterium]
MALIVVIENSPLMRPVLRDLLQLEGHTVITAGRMDEAWGLLHDIIGVDLVIADYAMPEMDGATLVRRLRESAKYRTTPILMLTLNGDPRADRQALDAGANECLVPPITVAGLKNAVKRMLVGHQTG